MIRTLFGRPHAADNPLEVSNVLVASEGRRFSQEVIDLAVRLVRGQGGRAQVLTVARLWGTSFGLPNPGLRPSRREMAEQEENIIWAIAQLESAGVEADGHIVTTRNPCRSILSEARRKKCDAIVMGADPRRNWLVRSMMWSQEPYRVRGRTEVPVHLVCAAGQH
ncbi:nucleotide-binding universal stress UspA family protein [Mesorhizobium soli]|uniref:universal stress protein n=1 Tax=Pseudaminobacter soli (ex Li et al. 2025) TaxID=1295366 RepID=UPI002473CE7B|nr:universal stress protein [Mesorhizobium soli]MDH6233347.1 nucleotide-binding universal stress UspA family protein [Mesorhizobium soli]